MLSARGLEVAYFVEVNPRKIGQRIHGAPVISVDELPAPGESPLLIAVGIDGEIIARRVGPVDLHEVEAFPAFEEVTAVAVIDDQLIAAILSKDDIVAPATDEGVIPGSPA